MDLTPEDNVRLTSFVTKMIGHQRTMATGLVEVTKGMEQIATGYEALQLDVAQIRAEAYRAGRERIARYLDRAASDLRRPPVLLGDEVRANAWSEAADWCRDDTIWADSPEVEE